MICHIDSHIFGDGSGYNNAVFVNNVQLIHVQEGGQILKLFRIHGDFMLIFQHVCGSPCPCEVIFVEIFPHKHQFGLIVFQGVYHLLCFCIKSVKLLRFQPMYIE